MPPVPTPALAAPPRRILAICTRRLGDVLLTTALLRSLRRHWPGAGLDVLTLERSAQALEGNPDVSRVLPLPEGASLAESLRAIGGWRHYDLALSTLWSDRAHLTAFAAAPQRAGVVGGAGHPGNAWKAWLAQRPVDLGAGQHHTVIQYLKLADALGIPRVNELVPPRAAGGAQPDLGGRPYVVLHPAAAFRYKSWTARGWRALARWLSAQGLTVVLDAGPGEAERALLDAIVDGAGLPHGTLVRLDGTLRFPELTPLLEGARAYVGPDTGVTHLAAATGIPTVALFGPLRPDTWGPWPQGCDEAGRTPWLPSAPLQQRGNVWLVQGLGPCVPCGLEGCERHAASRADCLDQLPAARVIAAVDAALRQNARHGHPA